MSKAVVGEWLLGVHQKIRRRVTGDRARDLPPDLREQVLARLRTIHAPAQWLAMMAQKVELDEATERRMLGESLPPGLRLMA